MTLCHAITKSPSSSIATIGRDWSSSVVMLTWNSPPSATPAELYRWAQMPKLPSRSWGLCQATTKSPSASIATAALDWLPAIVVLTRNPAPWGVPPASNR